MKTSDLYKIFQESGQITIDSRKVPKKSMFFAIKGENFDGNKFAQSAIDLGASIAVISDEKYKIPNKTILVNDTLKSLQELAKYHRKQLGINIVGITGTNGKTTTKELVYKVLSQKYKTFATLGNFNNHIGVPLTLLSLTDEYEFAVVEMGANHLGEIAELCDLVLPNYGLITNVGNAHLEGFGSFENLIITKLALFESIKQNNGVFLLNTNNEILQNRVSKYSKIIKYGKSENSEVKITEVFNELFLKLVVKIKGDNHLIQTQLIGDYNIDNILAAISVGLVVKVPIEKIVDAIEDYKPANNRSEYRKTEKNALILDMYNANPTSMEAAINNFYEIDVSRKMLIVGDMLELGKNEKNEHQQIINLIIEKRFKDVVLVGKIFKSCTYPENFRVFENIEILNEYLNNNPPKNHSILLKASNGTGLKKCVQYL
ncbi:MAG: UDP-N-acetylmuramoyl-tripeptide--D-alanyl-D-alanine ligase [Bacteroidota bacterium]|nr:UDP-N-acetylmuramoyl-tripeptide--D-alanyl-D-alanine ligase [Bacteroidota bacterium]